GDDIVHKNEGHRLEFVLEDGAKLPQIDAIRLVEVEILVADTDEQLVLTDGIGALGEDRAKTFGGARHHAEGRIKGENKSRRGRGERQLAELNANFGVQRRKALHAGSLEVYFVVEA